MCHIACCAGPARQDVVRLTVMLRMNNWSHPADCGCQCSCSLDTRSLVADDAVDGQPCVCVSVGGYAFLEVLQLPKVHEH